MYEGLLHAHSGFRYIVLGLLIAAVINGIKGWTQNGAYEKGHEKISLFAMVSTHIQMLMGFVLYGMSGKVVLSDMGAAMKDPILRFFTVEHVLLMLIAVVLITIGRKGTKKMEIGWKKHKRIAITYGLAVVLIFVMIPWPFMKSFGTWF